MSINSMADPVLNIEHREELRDVPPEEEELFKELTGKTLDELNAEWKAGISQ